MSVHGRLYGAYMSSPELLRHAVGGAAAGLPASIKYGPSYERTCRELRKSATMTSDELSCRQNELLRQLCVYARNNIPYYENLFRQYDLNPEAIEGVEDIACLPVQTKEDVRRLGPALSPSWLSRRSYRMTTTGGTSGHPLSLRTSYSASAAEWAYMHDAWRRVGYSPASRRVVLRGELVTGRDEGKLWRHDFVNNALVLSSPDLNVETLPEMLSAINEFKPRFLHAYPSMAVRLAQCLELVDERMPASLCGLLLGSEQLFLGQRRALARAFRVPVLTWYGHSEKCILATGCEHEDVFHSHPLYGVTEIISASGRSITEVGEPGMLVGTGFINKAQVLIRYLTDDWGSWGNTCDCDIPGPTITGITGHRDQEILYDSDSNPISATILHGMHMGAFSQIREFRYVQDRPGAVNLLVVRGNAYSDSVHDDAIRELTRHFSGRIAFTIEEVETLPLAPGGKTRFVQQNVPRPVTLQDEEDEERQ